MKDIDISLVAIFLSYKSDSMFFHIISAKCTELPEAPQNGMVVAPKLDHGMVGKFECRDGYMLKGHNTTQCFFGNWTGMTPWCKEGKLLTF